MMDYSYYYRQYFFFVIFYLFIPFINYSFVHADTICCGVGASFDGWYFTLGSNTYCSCTLCPANTYQPTTPNSVGSSSCINCPSGTFSSSGSGACYASPTPLPTFSLSPTTAPSALPSGQPSSHPSSLPSRQPNSAPTGQPTSSPSSQPTKQPNSHPTTIPSNQPTSRPTTQPTERPSNQPSAQPTKTPSRLPSTQPTSKPSSRPSSQPTTQPSKQPSALPTNHPSVQPSSKPSRRPTIQPTSSPTRQPSARPSSCPSTLPTTQPTISPTTYPTVIPSTQPASHPTSQPSNHPTTHPTSQPTSYPSRSPSTIPTKQPSATPSSSPTTQPSTLPTNTPSTIPTNIPTSQPTSYPSNQPINKPTNIPSSKPTGRPSNQPTNTPSTEPSTQPTSSPSRLPTSQPSNNPTVTPSDIPSSQPSNTPTTQPTSCPTSQPSDTPTELPSTTPTNKPSLQPTSLPSINPSTLPTIRPSSEPSARPTHQPTSQPTNCPSKQPTNKPTNRPSVQPTSSPSFQPSSHPSLFPSGQPSSRPSSQPSFRPTTMPTCTLTSLPSYDLSYLSLTSNMTSPFRVIGNLTGWKEVIFPIGITITAGATSTSQSFNPVFSPLIVSQPTSGSYYVIFGSKTSLVHQSMTNPINLSDIIALSSPSSTFPFSVTRGQQSIYQIDTTFRSCERVTSWNRGMLEEILLCDPLSAECYVVFWRTSDDFRTIVSTLYSPDKDQFGVTTAVLQDINQDRLNDMIICANTKYCTVFFGRLHWPVRIDATKITAVDGYQITADGSWIVIMGLAVSSVNDMNGDGYEDIAIATLTSSFRSLIFIVFGRGPNSASPISLADVSNGVNGFRIYGEKGAYTGLTLTGIGDFNQDGYDDMAVGKILTNQLRDQSTIIIFGNKTTQLFDEDLSLPSDKKERELTMVVVEGAGFLVAGPGDLNDDSIPDVIVVYNPSFINQGRTYILTFPHAIDSPPTFLPSSTPSSSPSITPTSRPTSPPIDTSLTSYPSQPTTAAPSPPPSTTRSASPSITSSASPSTLQPTKAPSLRPAVIRPSHSPVQTLCPTIKPTNRPTFKPSPFPSSLPTVIYPSNSLVPSTSFFTPSTSDHVITITLPGTYYASTSSTRNTFEIQSTGRVSISAGTSANLFRCQPASSSVLTQVIITNFKIKRDGIDLSAFSSLKGVQDLSYQTSPLTLLLTSNYQIVLTSLQSVFPQQLQLMFSTVSSSSTSSSDIPLTFDQVETTFADPTIIASLCLMFVFLIFSCVGRSCSLSTLNKPYSTAKLRRKDSDDRDHIVKDLVTGIEESSYSSLSSVSMKDEDDDDVESGKQLSLSSFDFEDFSNILSVDTISHEEERSDSYYNISDMSSDEDIEYTID